MQIVTLSQIVRCPNCGNAAVRHYYPDEFFNSLQSKRLIHTECPICDYLMKMRSTDGSVIEAYAPSTHPLDLAKR